MRYLENAIVQSMAFYKDGFFGYGERGDFTYWSLAHIMPIVLMLISLVLLYRFKNKLKEWKFDENFRFIIGALCLFFFTAYYWRLLYVGNEDGGQETFLTKLPLELCEWNCCLSAFMIMKKSRKLFGISFLITNTFGIIPLFTPVTITNAGPTYFRYYQYWLMHILPFIADYYMLFVHGFEIKKTDTLRALAFCEVLNLIAIGVNRIVPGANYFYIAENTDAPSLVNILPDSVLVKWIIYSVTAAVSFALVYTVYLLVIQFSKSRRKVRTE